MAKNRIPLADGFKLKIKNRLKDHADDTWPFSSRTTDPEGWRLVVEKPLGRLKWKYLQTEKERVCQPQDTTTKYFLGLPTVCHPLLVSFTLRNMVC